MPLLPLEYQGPELTDPARAARLPEEPCPPPRGCQLAQRPQSGGLTGTVNGPQTGAGCWPPSRPRAAQGTHTPPNVSVSAKSRERPRGLEFPRLEVKHD